MRPRLDTRVHAKVGPMAFTGVVVADDGCYLDVLPDDGFQAMGVPAGTPIPVRVEEIAGTLPHDGSPEAIKNWLSNK